VRHFSGQIKLQVGNEELHCLLACEGDRRSVEDVEIDEYAQKGLSREVVEADLRSLGANIVCSAVLLMLSKVADGLMGRILKGLCLVSLESILEQPVQ
jgi:hypothetical protein